MKKSQKEIAIEKEINGLYIQFFDCILTDDYHCQMHREYLNSIVSLEEELEVAHAEAVAENKANDIALMYERMECEMSGIRCRS